MSAILLVISLLARVPRLDQKLAECALATLSDTCGFMRLSVDDHTSPLAGDSACVPSPRDAGGPKPHYGNRWVGADGSAYRFTPGYIGANSAARVYYVSRYGPASRRAAAASYAWVSVFRQAIRFPESVCGYGCWFYILLQPWNSGTGMVLNLGRTLVFRNRSAVARWYGERAFGPLNMTRCAFWSGAEMERTDDMGWASKAHAEGYDSIQVVDGQFGYPELIVSRPECLAQPRPLAACPPDGMVRAVPADARLEEVTLATTGECACLDGAYTPRKSNERIFLSNCEG